MEDNKVLQRINSRFFQLYLLRHLPLAFFAGVNPKYVNFNEAEINMKFRWINQNPFGSIYFAALCMGGEFSTGIIAQALILDSKMNVSMLLLNIEANFIKKAKGLVVFKCTDGKSINSAIERAIATKEGTEVTAYSEAKNENGDVIATFRCKWAFRLK
ncbi:MAG: DUF4442 domain-containing protein [Saprospiraceae bacterium]|jgi:hypothetical protein|nr:DUF4442 domain-containing protein [Saprospiraceae bacterium]